MKQFEIGKTYTTSSACDSDCVFSWTIVSRTAKSVKLVGDLIKSPVNKKIYTYGESETVFPLGMFSMAPAINA
jgi:hypothetical protein